MTIERCAAKWEGGECDRPSKSAGLCAGHYQRQRRGLSFTELRTGAKLTDAVTVTVRIPPAEFEALVQGAMVRGITTAEMARQVIAEWDSQAH